MAADVRTAFVSYSHEDEKFALKLAEDLKAGGAAVWMDLLDIKPGMQWDRALEDALDDCPRLLVILSPDSANSDSVRNEITFAQNTHKQVIPVLYRDCRIPLQLVRYQYIDLSDKTDYAAGLKALIKTLRAQQFQQSITPTPAPPGVPQKKRLDVSHASQPKAGVLDDQYARFIATSSDYRSLLLWKTGSATYSSYSPDDPERPFRQIRIPTTPGWVSAPTGSGSARPKHRVEQHHVLVLRDPIRPFEIQIGEYRATRWGRRLGRLLTLPGLPELKPVYPFLMHPGYRWLRMLLAEVISDPGALEYMAQGEHEDAEIRKVIARNPSAPDRVKTQECQFCSREYRDLRVIPQSFSREAILISNDFPFGPFFDYIVFPREPVHTWDVVEERNLFDMNWLVRLYLGSKYDASNKEVGGAAGIRLGSNSSTRHLVVARRSTSSADVNAPHIHKRFWGMEEGAANLADHLHKICLECESRGQDYLGSYLKALENAKMVIWSDENVALFVPFGQIALSELQVMVKRPMRTFLDLDEAEVRSLSRAEYIVARLYSRMDIASFDEIMLSLPFADARSETFRLIFTFITREADLGPSQLTPLYVMDRHPWDTVLEVDRVWQNRKLEDLS